MAVKFIADALNAAVPEKKDVIQVLIKNMGRYYPERSHKVVHASDVTKGNFCARQFRLMDVLEIKRPDQYIPAGLRATFDVGRATADLMTNEWAGESAIGHWECSSCEQVKLWTTKPKPGCMGMGKCRWRYREVEFVHQPSELSGSIDLLLSLGQKQVTPIEIKIIKAEEFEKIVAPLGEHRARTRLYLRIIAESDSPYKGLVDTQHAKVVYVSRGFGKKNSDQGQGQIVPFKEFDVYRDDLSVQPYIDRAQSVATARAEGTIPAKVCDSISCPQAKGCPVKAQCFSGGFGG